MEVQERVDKIEEAMMRLVYIQQKTEIEIQNLKNEMKVFKDQMLDFKDEMKAFKDEMLSFKDEMKAFKDEMKVFKDQMLDFKDEMKVFKDEMLDFKNEMKAFKDEMKVFKDQMLDFKDEMKAFKDEMKAFKDEMKAFKDEMLSFKDEMKAFKDEMKAFKDEMKAFKDEMLDFKDEMSDFKEWSRKNIENMNKQWGALANKMGTLVEDIFAPSMEIALSKYFNISPEIIDVRKYIRRGGESLEIDILALSESQKKAFVVEVKANPDKVEYIEDFMKKLEQLREFLPVLKDYRLYPIYAALDMKAKTVELLTLKGIYAMIVKGDILEIVNFEDLNR